MPDSRYKYVNIDIETYEKLARQAEENYRTIPAHIRFLVDAAELERGRVNPTEDELTKIKAALNWPSDEAVEAAFQLLQVEVAQ